LSKAENPGWPRTETLSARVESGVLVFFHAFIASSLNVMGDETIRWIILCYGLFGSFIALLVKSGGAIAFGNFLTPYVKSKKVLCWRPG
jgi:hypothetical protein